MTLARAIVNKAKIYGTFTLRSGSTSDAYFDKYQFESDPVLLQDITRAMHPLVPADTQVLAGLEMGGIPIVTMLSNVSRLPCAFIRKKTKDYGTCRYSEGADLLAKKILLIEDVVSSGGQLIETVNMLRGDGIEVAQALCVIDRQTGGYENLQDVGVELLSLYKQSELDASEA